MGSRLTWRAGAASRRGSTLALAAALAVLGIATAASAAEPEESLAAVGWGQNLFRQLGDGSSSAFSDVPVPVSGLTGVKAVASGYHHSLALLSNGTVMAWGENESGQLGDGATGGLSNVPVAVKGLSGVTAIAAGANHSLALLSNGTVMAWGENEAGQLGNGTTKESNLPVAVKGLSGVTAIAAGGSHSLALLSKGTAMAWGENAAGELGTGNTKASDVPVAVKGVSGATAISAGELHSLALSKGTVLVWGSNEQGQLADSEIEEMSTVPVTVKGLSGVTAISAGGSHSLALLSGGTVQAWGEDNYGELGNGVVTPREETPVAVSGLSGVSAISAGARHSLALLTAGGVMAWGDNEWGQLGDATVGGVSDVPVAVSGLGEVKGFSAGSFHSLAFGEPIPAVAGVSPSSGSTAGGTAVTISGSNFTGATEVRFGTASATSVTVESATSITAVSPAGSGIVDVTVSSPAGTSAAHPADRFTYVPAPSIKKLSPSKGPAAGGTTVKITGAALEGATEVRFGSQPATSFTVVSAGEVTAVSPAQSVATVDVTVTTPSGTTAITTHDHFKYGEPTVTGVSPGAGPAAGGTSVVITGTGFVAGTSGTLIKFGSLPATGVECSSDTSCTAIAPAGKAGTTVDVKASIGKATSKKNPPADSFTYT